MPDGGLGCGGDAVGGDRARVDSDAFLEEGGEAGLTGRGKPREEEGERLDGFALGGEGDDQLVVGEDGGGLYEDFDARGEGGEGLGFGLDGMTTGGNGVESHLLGEVDLFRGTGGVLQVVQEALGFGLAGEDGDRLAVHGDEADATAAGEAIEVEDEEGDGEEQHGDPLHPEATAEPAGRVFVAGIRVICHGGGRRTYLAYAAHSL